MKPRSALEAVLKSNVPIRWESVADLVAYPQAVTRMEVEVATIADGATELIWFVEHPPIYTAGTSAKPADLVDAKRFPVYETGRGGQYTYHGPGQRVAYVMLDLKKRGGDVRARCRRHSRPEGLPRRANRPRLPGTAPSGHPFRGLWALA